jgi:hypothetical protein
MPHHRDRGSCFYFAVIELKSQEKTYSYAIVVAENFPHIVSFSKLQ